jgi:hypothetical protein
MMTAQLFRHLDANSDAVPQEFLGKIRTHFHQSSRSNLFFTAELIRILQLFNKNQIPAIPFKGPALAVKLYEDPCLREFGDLDILVKEQDVFRALKVLEDLNYGQVPAYRPAVQSRILRLKNHYTVMKANMAVAVELHWRMVPAYFMLPQYIDTWWKRAEFGLFEGQSVLTLSPEDLLIALCIHGCKHLWQCLAWFGDLARILERHPKLDWDYIFSEYGNSDLERMLFLSLIAAADLLNAPVPAEILQMARKDSTAVQLARESQARIFLHSGKREAFRFVKFQLRTKSNWADRARFCYRIITTPVLHEPDIVVPRFLSPFRRLLHGSPK